MEGDGSDNEGNNDFFNPEEEVGIAGTAKVRQLLIQPILPIVDVKTGEEDEECIFKIRAKLFRWRNNEWKERGIGDLKLLRNKTSKKIRLIERQDKTLKPVANFIIAEDPLCAIKEHQGSDKMFFLSAYDFSEEQPQIEKFVIKLGNAERKYSCLMYQMVQNSKPLLLMQKNSILLSKMEKRPNMHQ